MISEHLCAKSNQALPLSHAYNKLVSQMRESLAARREPVGAHNRLPSVLYVFEHKA